MAKNALNAPATIKQARFVATYEAVWRDFDALCQKMSDNKKPLVAKERYAFVALYRQICEHYALASQRHYSPMLVEALQRRALLGHKLMYRPQKNHLGRLADFVWRVFPSEVRKNARLFWLSFALFYGPLALMAVACFLDEGLIYTLMPSRAVWDFEYMYNPENAALGRAEDRSAQSDLAMFGHYIQNNVGIDFKIYASGVFFGVGTAFAAVYNGVAIGAVAGHLTGKGFGQTFWPFVAGHGSFELTAAVIATMAGFKLATPLLAPAPYSRKEAFLVAGRQSARLIFGAALMTFIAAFIEAFWSAKALPNGLKYSVAALLWALVAWYLLKAGKGKKG